MAYIAAKLADMGKTEEAIETIKEAIETAREIGHKDFRTEYYRIEAMAYIAAKLADMGKTEEAIETAREIRILSIGAGILADIAAKLADMGKIDLLIRIVCPLLSVQACLKSLLSYRGADLLDVVIDAVSTYPLTSADVLTLFHLLLNKFSFVVDLLDVVLDC